MSYSARPTSTNQLTQLVNLVAHGFTVGQVLIDRSGTWVTAQADSLINSAGSWIVSIVPDANSFYVTQTGWVNNLTGPYTIGIQYYLSPTVAGTLTSTKPTTVGQVVLPCFVADTATSGFFYGGSGEVVASGPVSSWNVNGTNETMTANAGYIITGAATVSKAIPALFQPGDQFIVMLHDPAPAAFVITMPGGVTVSDVGAGVATTAGGTISSTVQGNTIVMIGVIANTELRVLNSKGALTYA